MVAARPVYTFNTSVADSGWFRVRGSCEEQLVGMEGISNCCPGSLLLRSDLERNAGTGIIWALLLCWVFMGVALGADAFMSSIETITSQLKLTTVTVNGVKKKFHTRVWNDTVANLTLMALGSSAPEILLSFFEVAFMSDKGYFYSGDLGPSTIVGSAAFNLMVIIAVCICAIPEGEVRTLKHLTVFAVTATFSLFAYIWLVIVLVATSPNIITPLEAALTFAFMFLLVGIAYLADKGYLSFDGRAYASRGLKVLTVKTDLPAGAAAPAGPVLEPSEIASYLKALESGGAAARPTGDAEEGGAASAASADDACTSTASAGAASSARVMSPEQIAASIKEQQEKERPKTRTDHRKKALKGLTGGLSFKSSSSKSMGSSTKSLNEALEGTEITLEEIDRASFVGFAQSLINVVEGDDEHAVLEVQRTGCLDGTLSVHYATRDGTAKAGSDFDALEGDLVFAPNEVRKEIRVRIIDDDEIEDDEEFYVALSSPAVTEAAGGAVTCRLAGPRLHAEATVLIKDDDKMPGTFQWKDSAVRCRECDGSVTLTVQRKRGHNGEVTLKYDTRSKEALEGADFEGAHGELTFAHGELSKTVEVKIIDDTVYEKDERFLVVLSSPSEGALFRADTDGRADSEICTVTIESDDKMKSKIERVAQLLSIDRQRIGKCSDLWCDQAKEALLLDDDARTPYGIAMHVLMLPWKFLFGVCCPPAEVWGGKGLFIVSLLGIMLQVMLIGDLASQVGCIIGLRDSVTAITIVALGTSLPDLFASMQAARDEPTADNSIGNVTGSNSVNVFMGLGVPWLAASIWWAGHGATDDWKRHYPGFVDEYPNGGFVVCAGSLAFSVVVYTCVAILTIGCILARRFLLNPSAELGGDKKIGYATAALFLVFYFTYIIFSILRAEGIGGFESFLKEQSANPSCP
jgi:solute carrier family 8 (sodium/calcium exchanger)